MLIPDSSGQKLVLRNVGRRESGLYICRVSGNIINSIVINSIVINIIVINNIANIIISMRLKNSLHISKVDDNILIMMVTGLQYNSLQLCGSCCFFYLLRELSVSCRDQRCFSSLCGSQCQDIIQQAASPHLSVSIYALPTNKEFFQAKKTITIEIDLVQYAMIMVLLCLNIG